ncbi:hypothetical protein JCM10207_001144 [Rhodosporidiobolus poonsookiae]
MSPVADVMLAYAGHGGGGGGHGGTTSTNGTTTVPLGKMGKIAVAHGDQAYAKYYNYIFGAVIGFLFLRRLFLGSVRFYARRRKSDIAVEKGALGRGALAYESKPTLERWSDAVDTFWLKPVNVPFLPGDYTRLRVALNVVIFTINTVFSFVGGPMTVMKKYGTDTAMAFSLRTGMIATANYPALFLLAGRNSPVGWFTGINYQELRYYHIVFGVYAFWLSLLHTVTFVAHYYMYSTGAKALAQACQQLYFQLGIVALVFMGTNWIFGLKWVRRSGYELFLMSHIIGAALVLAGSYYHRPSMIPYTYAAAGIWVFERVCRWTRHIVEIGWARLYVRRPLYRCTASVVDGAIKLSVPIKGHKWQAGQHYYISFYGAGLLRRPWLYGQTHPFSTVNVPDESAATQDLRFLLRVHGGLTKDIAQHIQKRCEAKGGIDTDLLITLEGPYGWAEDASGFDSVVLVAGGSGITHPVSTMHELAQQALAGKAVTSSIKLIWAMHHYEQANWARETIEESRAWASKAGVSTSVDLYVTRSESRSSSGASTPTTETSSFDGDEKKSVLSDQVDFGGRAERFYGRPDVEHEVTKAIAGSPGRTLVVVCGPNAIADAVRRATMPYSRSQVVAESATFEC